ncbi:MAG: polymer-forming cytoskeletal protein [bacterium]
MRKGKSRSDFGRGGELSTIIGKDTDLKGNIKLKKSLRIDGTIMGDVKTSDTIIIGKDGTIDGTVTARNVLMGGKVKGNVIVSEKVFLESSASIEGDITALQLVVDEGAHFNGKCNMKDKEGKFTKNNVNKSGDTPS